MLQCLGGVWSLFNHFVLVDYMAAICLPLVCHMVYLSQYLSSCVISAGQFVLCLFEVLLVGFIKVQDQMHLLYMCVMSSVPYGRDLPVLFDLLESDQIQQCNVAITRAQAKQVNTHSEILSALPKTTACIKHHFYWPGLSKDVAPFCKSCPQCQIASVKIPISAALQPLPVIGIPFERLGMEIVGSVERSKAAFPGGKVCVITPENMFPLL